MKNTTMIQQTIQITSQFGQDESYQERKAEMQEINAKIELLAEKAGFDWTSSFHVQRTPQPLKPSLGGE